MSEHWPTSLRIHDNGRKLEVVFDNGASYVLAAEYLRVESPSAEVKGHGPGQEQLVFGKKHVTISKVEAIGSYAVRLIFSDGHGTGLYTWEYLAKLGEDESRIWDTYVQKLKTEGRTRD